MEIGLLAFGFATMFFMISYYRRQQKKESERHTATEDLLQRQEKLEMEFNGMKRHFVQQQGQGIYRRMGV